MNVAVHQKEKENKIAGKKEPKEKKRRAIACKRLSAALLRSFREEQGEKNVGCEESPE